MSNKKNSNEILLSIVIPFHNRIKLLIKTIESIKKNINKNYEIILVDDNSKNNSKMKLKKVLDKRTIYFKIDKSERGFARNYGAHKAKGKYVNFFDSDDLSLNNHVEEFSKYIKKNNYPLVFTNSYYRKKNNNKNILIKLKGNLNKKIFKNNILSCNSVFIKKSFFLKNKFCEDIKLSGSEDWDLWLRLASKTMIKGNNVPTTVLIDHSDRSTKKQNTKKILTRLDTLYQRVTNKKILKLSEKFSIYPIAEIYFFKSMVISSQKSFKLESLKLLLKVFLLKPIRLLELRSIVILKNLIF